MGIGHKGHKDHKGKERTLLLSVWEILNLTGFEPIAVTAVLGAGDLCVLLYWFSGTLSFDVLELASR